MATFVATNNAINDANGTSLSVTLTAKIQRGDLLCVWDKREGAATTSVVKDNQGNVYSGRTSPIRNTTNNDLEGEWWFSIAKNASVNPVITQILAASRQFRRTHVLAFRPRPGFMFRQRPDQIVRAFGSSATAISAGSLSVLGPGVGVLGVGEYAAATFTPGTGWTEANDNFSWTGYRIESLGSLITGNCTAGSAMDFIASFAYIQEVPIPGTPYWWATLNAGTPTNDIAASGSVLITGSAALTSIGSLAAAGTETITGSAALTSAGTVAAAGALSVTGSAALNATGTLAAAGSAVIVGSATLTATGDIAAAGTLVITGSANMASPNDLASAGSLIITGSSVITATGTVAASGAVTITGAATLTSIGTLAAAGTAVIVGAADLTAASANDMAAAGSILITSSAALSAVGTLAAAGAIIITGAARLDDGAIVLATQNVPAGSNRRRRTRNIYRIRVDGHAFEFKSLADALQFLQRTKTEAQTLARQVARNATERQKASSARVQVPTLPKPKIEISSRELRGAVSETQREIAEIYAQAIRDAEVAIVVELERRKREDEDLILWLM